MLVLDAVRGKIMQQGGVMRPRRPIADEIRSRLQLRREAVEVAGNHRVDGRLERIDVHAAMILLAYNPRS